MIIYFLRLMNCVYSSLGYSSALHLATISHSYVFCLNSTALYIGWLALKHVLASEKTRKFGLQMHHTESFTHAENLVEVPRKPSGKVISLVAGMKCENLSEE